MKRYFMFPLLCFLIMSCSDNIDVLIITGKTNPYHDCSKMAKCIQSTLSEYDKFRVDIMDITQYTLDAFSPKFQQYDAVVLNFDLVEWSDATKQNFVNYVRNGGGVVVVHEADNAFPDWKEYNEIIGLGGWGGRKKSAGPYYYWKDGDFVRDDQTEGRGGGHGKPVPYYINLRDSVHPITAGLPTRWLHLYDELYCNLRGPIGDIHPLATAFSDKETGGSGKEELVLFTIKYGKGRVFHTVLGHASLHDDNALRNRGFQVTLARGTEWAATGAVKQKTTFSSVVEHEDIPLSSTLVK